MTFCSTSGTYRCHWNQSRARKRIDGTLQETKHEIADAFSGKILESKKTEVRLAIEDKTGMNFERFTRSILLAQGSFAAFLQASADQRSPILEQITGTEIYSDISKKIHERQKNEKDKLDILSAELGGITVLDDEQVNSLKGQYNETSAQTTRLKEQQKILQESLRQHDSLKALSSELATLKISQTEVLDEVAQFIPSQDRLNLALKAADLEGEFATLMTLRREQQKEQHDLSALAKQLPEIIHKLEEENTQLNTKKTALLESRARQQQAIPIITEVRKLDVQQHEKKSQQQSVATEIRDLQTKIAGNRRDHQTYLNQQAEIVKKSEKIAYYLASHPQDSQLIETFFTLQEQLNNFQQRLNDLSQHQLKIKQKEKALAEIELEFKKANEQQIKVLQNYQRYDKQIKDQQSTLSDLLGDRLLREYRSDKDHLQQQKIFMTKIINLQQERQKLIDGEACPLCGSLEHPFSSRNTPQINEVDKKIQLLTVLIESAEKIITDRYLLIPSIEHALELSVIDNYQGGEIRSTKNLSGGESFIVSLALALGLSKMSSQKVRVDSLSSMKVLVR